MNKKDLIDFLKENMTIELDGSLEESNYGSTSAYVSATIYIDKEIICNGHVTL